VKRLLALALGLLLALPSVALAAGEPASTSAKDFDPSEEWNLHEWIPIHLGPLNLSITKAVVYLMLGTLLTILLGVTLMRVKVPGRRGRKPKEFQPENDEVAALNAVERAELKAVDKAKAKDRKAKEKALLKDAFSSDTEASEEELERRRQKLKTLIKLGKERGFLTFSEINDHLPENIVDPEAIEGIIGTFNDMGIAVYEHAPDAEQLLLSDNVASAASDDDAEAAAEAALSTVDSDFGRTTDPVRMYMREMGSVELLTREGEIEIAKRIEGGLRDMIHAISACPTTIAEILVAGERLEKDEIKVDDIVDDLVDLSSGDVAAQPAGDDEDDEEDEDALEDEEEETTTASVGGASTSPIACARGWSLRIREPSTSPVSPESPVRV